MSKRLLGALLAAALVVVVGAVGAGSAAAAWHVAPGGARTACTEAEPCDLVTGIEGAAAGDEVVIATGTVQATTTTATVSPVVATNGGRTEVTLRDGTAPGADTDEVTVTVPAAPAPGAVAFPLTGLAPLATHHYEVRAERATAAPPCRRRARSSRRCRRRRP